MSTLYKHQRAISIKFHITSYISQDSSFYASLHAGPSLQAIKEDYQGCRLQFRTALNKFIERYFMAKSILIPRLSLFLYSKVDAARIKSGAMIQVESINCQVMQIRGIKWY
ncbi:hypothetical protein C1646_763917 [Rhizophagus diaphanus]|nr:hypothetical protein C1646_763917 [Rhizophagus diaphanus] [Rhizophagus sp. MUCL 43196]